MSKEMREKINRVMKWKEYLTENISYLDFIYHGTSLENAENIIEYGFTEDTYWGDKSLSEQYAYSYDKPVLIRLKKSELLPLLEPNTTLLDFYKDNIDEDEDYKNIIDMWNVSSKTVDDSLEIMGSVILPPNNLTIGSDDIIRI